MDSQGQGIALDRLDFNLTSGYLTRHCDGLVGRNGTRAVNECPGKMTKSASVDRPRRRAICKKCCHSDWRDGFSIFACCVRKSRSTFCIANVSSRITPQRSHRLLIVFSTTEISTYHCSPSWYRLCTAQCWRYNHQNGFAEFACRLELERNTAD